MGKVIAIANSKGGVGKTTTSVSLASCFSSKGRKVLAIDADQQGNLTSGFGINKNDKDYTLYEVMTDDCDIRDAILSDPISGVDVIPTNMNLAAIQIDLADVDAPHSVLSAKLDEIKDNYEYIFIDCGPCLETMTLNVLNAADSLIIPVQCEYYALEGLSGMFHVVRLVRESGNKQLGIEGILMSMASKRANISSEVIKNVRENAKERVFDTVIPRNVSLAEAPSFGRPINIYSPRSAGAKAYMELAEEIISQEEKR